MTPETFFQTDLFGHVSLVLRSHHLIRRATVIFGVGTYRINHSNHCISIGFLSNVTELRRESNLNEIQPADPGCAAVSGDFATKSISRLQERLQHSTDPKMIHRHTRTLLWSSLMVSTYFPGILGVIPVVGTPR